MAEPRKAILIGRPVKHARSPLIHGFWLEALGIPGAYHLAEVMPGAVKAFLQELPGRGYAGGNVTVPHKEEAFAACDRVTDRALSVGAVNTFWFEGGALVGDNTDGIGFIAHLDQTHPSWDQPPPHVLVLGAGGAARGVIAPLLDRQPASITIANRSSERAAMLETDLRRSRPDAPIRVIDWESRDDALTGKDLVINTTSLGMSGHEPLPLDLARLTGSAIVADIVYVPLETPLLAAARARGLRVLDGLGMLLHQAVPGFERWFGARPEVTPALRAHLAADLENRG
jgi:shikimate dehydrogenase